MKRFSFFGNNRARGAGAHPMPEAGSVTTMLAAAGDSLTFTVTNISPAPQSFCMFQTPFEDFRADYLAVLGPDGVQADYIGVKIKRNPPSERHFLTLAPGESKSASIALSAGYRLVGAGPWSVQFKGQAEVNGLPDSNTVTVGAP